MARLRRLFLTGLAVLLPTLVTIHFLNWFFRFADGIVGRWFARFQVYIPGLGIVVGLSVIVLTGLLATNILGRQMITFGENLITKMPLARGVYLTVKQMVSVFLNPSETSFRRVVLVEYPRPGVYSLGFVTGETSEQLNSLTGEDLVNVFVPTAPNPTSGFLVLVPRKDVKRLDITVEQGLKLVVSIGIVDPLKEGREGECQRAS